ncbi:hypothetical protein [Sporofaciens sp. SGI.106]|uniref:hypothetical protein n=1 Tax=Sporofaciens sp. SGI.106 TaxID=3420568 RepID=UPI003D027357
MAAKKKNAETVETIASNVIAVDARRLSQGLKMTFEGMAMVFDSIGVDAAVPTVKADDAKTEVPADTASADKAGGVEETMSEKHNTAPAAEEQNPATEAENMDTAEDTAAEAQPDASEPTNAVSLDDITKIIVQKIKQNRSNNEKIGSILKTYGVAKVGELPVSKYEAFLTDLSAI